MTHEEMNNSAYNNLLKALPKTCTPEDRDPIDRAFNLAKEAHAPQTRNSGIPYITHPLAVALISVKEMRQTDHAIVAAALLHDVVEVNAK